MTEGDRKPAAPADALAAIGALIRAETPQEAATATARWLRAQPGVVAAAILLRSGSRTAVEASAADDDEIGQLVVAELATCADTEPPFGERTSRTVTLESGARCHVLCCPLQAGERWRGAWTLARKGEQDGGDDVDAAQMIDVLTAKLEAISQTARLRQDLAQTKRWFNTLDSQLRVLERERQKLSAVVSQSDTLMMVLDGDLSVRWANAALGGQLREVGHESPIGLELQSVWDALGAELPRPWSASCPAAQAFREGAAVHAESTAAVAGEVHSLYLTFLPIRTPRGETAELLVMIQDLSDLEMLRRSETRYRLLFERSPDAMIMVAPDTGRIVLANDVACRLAGYERGEIVGLDVRRLHDTDDWPRAERDYAAVMDSDRALFAERTLRAKSREPFTAEVTAMRFDLDGRLVTFIEFRDVTERKRLEDELRHSQKMEAVGQLAGGVAHDFNNILTVLVGEAELLAGTPDLPEPIQQAARVIGRETRRASLLIRKLLAISRKELATADVLDLNEVLRDVEDLLRPLIGESITLHLSLSDAPCPVLADRAQLEQIVINLAVNARDAMPQGGGLWIEAEPVLPPAGEGERADAPAEALLTVRDDGTGMDGPTCQQLFEPFFTTKPPGQGTGLGLSTVNRIVQEHEGSIEVETEPGAGTCFRIRLPLAAGSVVGPTPSVPPQAARAQERLLLVEDRPELRKLNARVLRQAGYEVVCAESAEAGLAIVESATEPFDLLVTDVVLPQMSGGALAAEVERAMPGIQVLYVSGYAEDAIVQRGVSTSQAAFLAKPFSPKALLHAIRKRLDGKG
ncbi:MAG: PAS domain-containing protein [Deltaproteobacteria bacterium]|jgi:PAS domain S-box-containing protein|nr:PAS domain-containing protein [Deltaproteobacteria bacterium]MBW2530087.1 PAS domain-containing protein [Deltaproteobacteria bacterium]